MEEGFGRYHPLVNFIFFAGAVILGMFIAHPAFLCVSAACSLVYFLLLKKAGGLKELMWIIVIFAAIALLNPLFNTNGDTVLFTYFGGRPYTKEALYYGFATGAMFFSVILWFACYNAVMSSDKFIFLFGRLIPSLSLVLSMTLRLVPELKRRAAAIAGARRCLGKGGGDKKEKLENGMTVLSVLTSWALEGAVTTGDSMKSRGYGSGERESFAVYRRTVRDKAVCAAMACALAVAVLCVAKGGAAVEYIPSLDIAKANAFTAAGAAAYAAFLAIPPIIHITEDITWRILRSKI